MSLYLRFLGLFMSVVVWGHVAVSPSFGSDGTLRLDLDTCVRMALEVNVSILKAEYDLNRAGSNVMASASQLLPGVGLQSTHSKYEETYLRQIGDRVITTDQSYTAALTISETVTLGSVAGLFESLASRHATRHYLRGVKHDVAFAARQKYLGVLKAKRLLAVRQEALDLGKRRLDRAQALLDVGSAVRSDVLRAQVEMSRNELDLIEADNALRLAETDMRHLLGIEDDVGLELDDILETHEVNFTLEGALAVAMEHRPDILYAAETVKAAEHSVWRERGGWFPSVRFGWSDRYTADRFPRKLGTLRDDAAWSWDLSASLDLFDGFYTWSRVRSAKASLGSAREDLVQFKRDAALEVKQAFYNVEEARQRVKVSKDALGLAEEELRLAEERYRLGGGTMLEQIDAQVALSETRTSHVEALYDYLLSQAALVRAMGKD